MAVAILSVMLHMLHLIRMSHKLLHNILLSCNFSTAIIKYFKKSKLKKEEFLLSHNSRLQYSTARKTW